MSAGYFNTVMVVKDFGHKKVFIFRFTFFNLRGRVTFAFGGFYGNLCVRFLGEGYNIDTFRHDFLYFGAILNKLVFGAFHTFEGKMVNF